MKTVIEMAREATLLDSRDDWSSVPDEYREAINAFAELVRADEREKQAEAFQQILAAVRNDTRADEREACAKVAEDSDHVVGGKGYYDQLGDADATVRNIAAAIRARGQA